MKNPNNIPVRLDCRNSKNLVTDRLNHDTVTTDGDDSSDNPGQYYRNSN